MKLSYNLALYATGAGKAYYAAKGVDPTADLTGWLETFQNGEPYTSTKAGRPASSCRASTPPPACSTASGVRRRRS